MNETEQVIKQACKIIEKLLRDNKVKNAVAEVNEGEGGVRIDVAYQIIAVNEDFIAEEALIVIYEGLATNPIAVREKKSTKDTTIAKIFYKKITEKDGTEINLVVKIYTKEIDESIKEIEKLLPTTYYVF